MKQPARRTLRTALAATCLMATLPLSSGAFAATCEFAPVKAEIDTVIDKDEKRGAEFRRQFKDGTDSIAALDTLVTAEMREKIDICRFDVAEYLTKRGFPPPH